METTSHIISILPSSKTGTLSHFSSTCPGCGYVQAYTIKSMVEKDYLIHKAKYCKGAA